MAPVFELEASAYAYRYVAEGSVYSRLPVGRRGILTLDMYPLDEFEQEKPSERAIDMLTGIANGMAPPSRIPAKDVSDIVYGAWGNQFSTLVGPDTPLPQNRFWGDVYAAKDLPQGRIVCVHRNAGTLVYNLSDVAFEPIAGIHITTKGSVVSRVNVPPHSFGGFVLESLVQTFHVS